MKEKYLNRAEMGFKLIVLWALISFGSALWVVLSQKIILANLLLGLIPFGLAIFMFTLYNLVKAELVRHREKKVGV